MEATGGGAATNGGVEFQQRVSAWFAVAMLKSSDISYVFELDLPFVVETLSWETSSAIDDLLIRSREHSVLVQIKRSLDLSATEDSEFRSVIEQFVARFLEHRATEYYALVISPQASRNVSSVLAKLLLAIRLNEKGYTQNPLSKKQIEVFDVFRHALDATFLALAKRAMSEDDFVQLCRRVRVVTMDVEESRPDERVALMQLQGMPRTAVNAQASWSAVLKQCLRFASGRLSCTREPLEKLVVAALPQGEQELSTPDEVLKFEFPATCPSGREVILGTMQDHPGSVFLIELFRFDQDGSRLSRFDSQTCTLKNGLAVQLHRRSATVTGVLRYLDAHVEKYEGLKVLVAEIQGDEDPDISPHAEAHGLLVAEMMRAHERKFLCLVCGFPALAADSELVEIDEESLPHQAGVVHVNCVRSSFRVLGRLSSDLFEKFPSLSNFDIQLWMEKIRNGQGLLASMAGRIRPGMVVAWKPDYRQGQYGYCLRMDLEDGSFKYVTDRMRVHRFKKVEGAATLAKMSEVLEVASKRKDPYCVNESGIFSPLSRLLNLAPGEKYSRVVGVELVPFSVEIGKLYDACDNFYAPLCVVRTLPDEEEIVLHDSVFLISDPLDLERYLGNWREAGMQIGQVRMDIIADDPDFDAFMRTQAQQDRVVVIDPLLDLRGELVAGLPIMVMPVEPQAPSRE